MLPLLVTVFNNIFLVFGENLLNNADFLCGTFDGDKNNDLTKRDGTLYTVEVKHPNEFSLSWRYE